MRRYPWQKTESTLVPMQFQAIRLFSRKMPVNEWTTLLSRGAGIQIDRETWDAVCEWLTAPIPTRLESMRMAQFIARQAFAAEHSRKRHILLPKPIDFIAYVSGAVDDYLSQVLSVDFSGERRFNRHIPTIRLRPPGTLRPDPKDPTKRVASTEWTADGIHAPSLQGARIFFFKGILAQDDGIIRAMQELTRRHEIQVAGLGVLVNQHICIREKDPGTKVPLFYLCGKE